MMEPTRLGKKRTWKKTHDSHGTASGSNGRGAYVYHDRYSLSCGLRDSR